MITTVTLTGADDSIHHNDLLKLSDDYPFVEFGILFSTKRIGTERYPSLKWLDELFEKSSELNLSAHLCGDFAREVICGSKTGDFILERLSPHFKRVQLNYNFSKETPVSLCHFINFTKYFSKHNFILQYNKSNKIVCDAMVHEDIDNLQFLYDASGGRGKAAESFDIPVSNYYTGYAGGISPINIIEVCKKIEIIVGKTPIWIDMETHIRSNSNFDFKKCNEVLAKSERFIRIDQVS